MQTKYLNLLKNIVKLKGPELLEIQEALKEDVNFIQQLKAKMIWSPEQHNGLIKLLQLPKRDGFSLDTYSARIKYNGIKTLKSGGTELQENIFHDIENDKCRDSYKYFRANYCFIVTKSGLARPDPRDYQENLENELLTLEDLIILYPRQSGKTVTVATYLLWISIFHKTAINIGIVANKGSTAREVLDKIKKIFQELPIWMMPGLEAWNKASIEYDTGTRIMAESPSSDSFRGYTINVLYEDESAYIAGNLYSEYVDSVYPTMNSLIYKQILNSSTPKGMNHFHGLVNAARDTNLIEPTETILEADEEIIIGGYNMSYTLEELHAMINLGKV